MPTSKTEIRTIILRANHQGHSRKLKLKVVCSLNGLDARCQASGKVFGQSFNVDESTHIGLTWLRTLLARAIYKQTKIYISTLF